MTDQTPESIARVCHEANRAYCLSLGDTSQPPWEEAPAWQRDSAIKGVVFSLANPTAPPSASHDSWLEEKLATGWSYGPVKDPEKKEHPCFVPYDQLPPEQRRKDALFVAVVRALGGEEAPGHVQKPPTQQPSIGRIVHYTFHSDEADPNVAAAIVTGVEEDGTTVALTIFARSAIIMECGVAYSETPAPGCWSWPPRT